MRTNVTRQFRSRERNCLGAKCPGTNQPAAVAAAVCVCVQERPQDFG